jgi:carboxymethylenebutenolidase
MDALPEKPAMNSFDSRTGDRAHFDSLRPGVSTEKGSTRRTALRIAMGVGYAAATLPIAAQTVIHTPTDGLVSGPISFTVDGFEVPGYAARPAGKTGLPVILVVEEVFGITDYIADVCRRFARLGYLAVAPEVYARQGDPRTYTDIPRLISEIIAKTPDAQVRGDLDGALQWAAANGGDISRAGVIGFCRGGRTVWLYATQGTVKAAVAFYGPLAGTPSAIQPRTALDVGPSVKAPVLALYGAKDPGIPLEQIEKQKAAVAAGTPAARASQFVIYPEAAHGFHADYRPSYVASAAEDGWARAIAWFKAHGVGPGPG